MRFNPHAYQTRAIDFVLDHPFCGLFLGMGLGKSVITLTAVDRLLYDYAAVNRVLVIAPKSVARNTWTDECAKWDHLSHLRLSVVMGTPAQRLKALNTPADIYVTNRDNVTWLVAQGRWRFDCVILDESSSFKNPQSRRWKALWKARPLISRLVLLTGTPAPNGLMDLWAQAKLLDKGQRLGKYIGQYRDAYFTPGARSGAVVYSWLPRPDAKEAISGKLSDICLSMRPEDYLSVPDMINTTMALTLDNPDAYKRFEASCVMALEDGSDILATTAVSLVNKLLQFSSGAIYDDEHNWHLVSDTKMDALSDLLEQTDEPVLLFYNYQHERDRILTEHPEAVVFTGEPEILQSWNAGQIRLILCHPASVSYGLNMQAGGHVIVWFSPTWNLDLYEQANARLHRQGQARPVIIYHLISKGTMDERVMAALQHKGDTQTTLLDLLKATIHSHQSSNT